MIQARAAANLHAAQALTVLDARQWTRLVHLSKAKKRFLEILGHAPALAAGLLASTIVWQRAD